MEDNISYLIEPLIFDIEREYLNGDQIVYNGEIYLALRTVTGEIPGRSDGWTTLGTSSAILSNSIYEELREQLETITQNYNNTSGHDPFGYPAGNINLGMWEVSTGANTSSSLSDEVAVLRAEIHTLRSEIAQIKRELKVARAKEEKEHRKLSV